MRYNVWDVVIYPADTGIPLQEYQVNYQVVQDRDSPYLTNPDLMQRALGANDVVTWGKVPLITCFIPSMKELVPMQVSIHHWAYPEPTWITLSTMIPGDTLVYGMRVLVDGVCLGGSWFTPSLAHPFTLMNGGQAHGPLLRFPPFHPEVLKMGVGDANASLGRIKVVISEGIARPGWEVIEPIHDVAIFSFQHVPHVALKSAQIAWPNPYMWGSAAPRWAVHGQRFFHKAMAHEAGPEHDRNDDDQATPRASQSAKRDSPSHGSCGSRPFDITIPQEAGPQGNPHGPASPRASQSAQHGIPVLTGGAVFASGDTSIAGPAAFWKAGYQRIASTSRSVTSADHIPHGAPKTPPHPKAKSQEGTKRLPRDAPRTPSSRRKKIRAELVRDALKTPSPLRARRDETSRRYARRYLSGRVDPALVGSPSPPRLAAHHGSQSLSSDGSISESGSSISNRSTRSSRNGVFMPDANVDSPEVDLDPLLSPETIRHLLSDLPEFIAADEGRARTPEGPRKGTGLFARRGRGRR
ncbi:hypothetical protein N7539_006924 [Penicillium diatomitis]|uniref:Uncharacterized protein n=1 Tax=Penicillium diatomitis TaxID=2819901 RepID=A0A9W9X2G9_9EURO|nr:uncharacterized protein N7539_006924 [Penicillium diatomitis]KAJ5481030.1 hypothetical protein N7539_006924 [Penicillium diatomitis]